MLTILICGIIELSRQSLMALLWIRLEWVGTVLQTLTVVQFFFSFITCPTAYAMLMLMLSIQRIQYVLPIGIDHQKCILFQCILFYSSKLFDEVSYFSRFIQRQKAKPCFSSERETFESLHFDFKSIHCAQSLLFVCSFWFLLIFVV